MSRGPRQARGKALPPIPPPQLQAALREAAEHRVARRDDEAISLYIQIEARNPEAVDAPYFLALIDLARHRPAEAARRLEALTRRLPSMVRPWQGLVFAYRELGRWQDALSALDRISELAPGEAQPERPDVLQVLGRMEESIAAYRTAARIGRTRAWALAGLAVSRPSAITDAERTELYAISQTGGVDERIGALFALGELEEHRGDDDAAFAAFAGGNLLKRQTLTGEAAPPEPPPIAPRVFAQPPDEQAKAHAAAISFRKTIFTGDFLAEYAGRGHHIAAPVFVVGMPRSGSTLIEQILSSHRKVQGLGEAPAWAEAIRGAYPYDLFAPNPPDHFRVVAEAYFKGMHAIGWTSAPRFVDKLLQNYMEMGMIHLCVPRAVILHAVRDPVDTCLACFRKNFSSSQEFSYDLGDVGREYVRYREMMDHWASVLPGRVIDVSHEALVADPEGKTRWLVTEACGLEWDDACLRFYETKRPVRTASVAQVRRPIFTTSIERWRRYEKHLGPLFDALGPYAPNR